MNSEDPTITSADMVTVCWDSDAGPAETLETKLANRRSLERATTPSDLLDMENVGAWFTATIVTTRATGSDVLTSGAVPGPSSTARTAHEQTPKLLGRGVNSRAPSVETCGTEVKRLLAFAHAVTWNETVWP